MWQLDERVPEMGLSYSVIGIEEEAGTEMTKQKSKRPFGALKGVAVSRISCWPGDSHPSHCWGRLGVQMRDLISALHGKG